MAAKAPRSFEGHLLYGKWTKEAFPIIGFGEMSRAEITSGPNPLRGRHLVMDVVHAAGAVGCTVEKIDTAFLLEQASVEAHTLTPSERSEPVSAAFTATCSTTSAGTSSSGSRGSRIACRRETTFTVGL